MDSQVQIAELKAENKRLRKALKPFAARFEAVAKSHIVNIVCDDDEVYIKIGHLHDAFDVLKQ